MGAVYRGLHRNATIARRQGGQVAVKVMHAQFARDETFRARFEREAGLSLQLDHAGIVKAHDLVVDGGSLAFVMELVEGRSLATGIGRQVGPLPWATSWPMFQQLLDAVEYAHSQGIVHRDLKPENVMVGSDGRLKILDFGIAKQAGGSGATATGVGMGTVDYMAPEQHTDAKGVDERADLYALGMVFYEALAGRLPWSEGLDPLGVLNWKLAGDIPPLSTYARDIDQHVVGALRSALATTPEDRIQSAAALREALSRSPVAAPPSGPTASPSLPGRPAPEDQPQLGARPTSSPALVVGLLFVGAMFVIAVVGLTWWSLFSEGDDQADLGSTSPEVAGPEPLSPEDCLRLTPGDSTCRWALGQQRYDEGDWRRAVEAWRPLLLVGGPRFEEAQEGTRDAARRLHVAGHGLGPIPLACRPGKDARSVVTAEVLRNVAEDGHAAAVEWCARLSRSSSFAVRLEEPGNPDAFAGYGQSVTSVQAIAWGERRWVRFQTTFSMADYWVSLYELVDGQRVEYVSAPPYESASPCSLEDPGADPRDVEFSLFAADWDSLPPHVRAQLCWGRAPP